MPKASPPPEEGFAVALPRDAEVEAVGLEPRGVLLEEAVGAGMEVK